MTNQIVSFVAIIAAAVVAAIFFMTRNNSGGNGQTVASNEPSNPVIKDPAIVAPTLPPVYSSDPIGSFSKTQLDPVTSDLSNDEFSKKILSHSLSGDPYRPDYDLNQDGKINSFDAALASRGQRL